MTLGVICKSQHYLWQAITSTLMNQYQFKRSFSSEPALSKQLFDLLETTFPGISTNAELCRNLGASWESVSTPFVLFQDDLAVAHVGVLELPLVIMGQSVTVGGIHGVCTRPAYRRRGYYRQVMAEVIDYCDRHYETLLLTTAQPELYTPFGFRVVEEHAFTSKFALTAGIKGFRILDLQDQNDQKLLHRLLEERSPVSNVVGVVKEKAVFLFNEGMQSLHYDQDLDIIVVLEIENTHLKLFDLVGSKICPLAAIVERIEQAIDEVTVYFSPDRLSTNFHAFSQKFEEDSLLMVRGPFAAESRQFMLPLSARC